MKEKIDLMGNFPWQQYPEIRPTQKTNLEIIQKHLDSVIPGQRTILIFEDPTGSGKTAIGFTLLKTLEKDGRGPLFYIVPTKAAVEEVKKQHPEVKIIFGRNEYDCLYYKNEKVNADEVPCSILEDCPHRVNQETGKTKEEGAEPCPYFWAKYQAKRGGIIVSTMAFYLFTHLFNSREWRIPAGLVIDEAHKITRVVRNCLKYEITDYHLRRAINFLSESKIDPETAKILKKFLKKMLRIISFKPSKKSIPLEAKEIRELMNILSQVRTGKTMARLREAVRGREIDPEKERETLRKVEAIIRDVTRYYHSFEYSLPTPEREPLNYTCAYYEKGLKKGKRVQFKLTIQAYYVAPLVQKILSPLTLAYSATIGDLDAFSFETGIKGPYYTFPSEFPAENTRLFMPIDTPDLAFRNRKRGQLTRVMKRLAEACKEFAENGIRSLVIMISEVEREKFLAITEEIGLKTVSYGNNGKKAKEAVKEFKEGNGEVLVGTVAQYGESIDLPRNIAPIIFFLRPGYPRPDDSGTIFEERRFGSLRWRLWTWRVIIEALQMRGRNIRHPEDLGITIFISQQFRRFLYAGLPEWLKEAYQGKLRFEDCLNEAKVIILGSKKFITKPSLAQSSPAKPS